MTARSVIEGVFDDNNAQLFWMSSTGELHDTEYTQHGLYVSDHPELFGVSKALITKTFKNARHDENFDFDGAAAVMCEEAFKRKWVRLLKVPWTKKILVEGQELTRAQRAVVEDMWFENRSWEVLWYRWVSSVYGPAKDTVLFAREDEPEPMEEGYTPAEHSEYTDSARKWAAGQSPHLADMLDMQEPLYDLIGQRHTLASDTGNFIAQYVEDEDDNLYLIGIVSKEGRLSRTDHSDVVEMVELLLHKLTSGKTLVTTPHEGSMKMLDYVVRRASRRGIKLNVEKGQRAVFGDSPTLRYQQVEVRAA